MHMATPLQTFGRGPTFLNWDGTPQETEQFGSARGDSRRNPRVPTRAIAEREDDTFAAVAPETAAPVENPGMFNSNIGAPSPSVQAALALPAGQRSLAQQKLLADRRGTEAMSAARGGVVKNGVTQALDDESSVAAATAQGRFDSRMADAYAEGVTGAPSRVPGSTEAAQSQFMPRTADPMASNSVSAPKQPGFAMRTMADGTVRTASGVSGANRNVSNMQTFGSEAEATAAFRPSAPATPGATASPGSMTPPDPRGMPGGGLPVAQMTMAGAGAAPQGGDPFAPTMPRLGLPASMRPARPAGPAASVPSMTPPMDDPLNPANRQAQTLQSSNAGDPWGRTGPRPQRQRSSNIIPQGIKDAFSYTPRPEEQAILDRRNGGTKAPAMGAPMQTPSAARTTAPTTQIKMTSKILGQPRNSGSQMMGAQLDPFRRF
jgi:hypothetical protein